MVQFISAIKRPFLEPKKLLLGWVLLVVPFANLITGIFTYGYILRCGSTAMRRQEELPEWTNWQQLFVDGIIVPLIGIIYAIPSIILFLLAGFEAIKSLFTGEGSGLGKSLFLLTVVVILTIYILPSALLSYATQRRFWDAFRLKTLRSAFTSQYFLSWLLSISYAIPVAIVSCLLILWTWTTLVVPFIIGSIATFVVSVSIITMLAQGYTKT